MISIIPGAVYRTRAGVKVQIQQPVWDTETGDKHFRARFLDTGEIVFYTTDGNIVSERPGPQDKPHTLVARVA